MHAAPGGGSIIIVNCQLRCIAGAFPVLAASPPRVPTSISPPPPPPTQISESRIPPSAPSHSKPHSKPHSEPASLGMFGTEQRRGPSGSGAEGVFTATRARFPNDTLPVQMRASLTPVGGVDLSDFNLVLLEQRPRSPVGVTSHHQGLTQGRLHLPPSQRRSL